MSITAGWMILAAVVLRLILKRAPKAVRYVLWALVAVRLICPISFESATSLIPNTDPVDELDLIYAPYETEYIPYTEFDPSADPDNAVYLEMFVAEAPDESAVSSDELLTGVWISGTAAMIIYCIISYAVLRHKVRASVKHRDNIYLCDSIGSPFILGTVRPRIYMPSSINEKQLSAVEAHERMHIRHGDHLWKVLGFLILAAYWWNPLIWLAYILFCRDIELICDEAVVRRMDIDDRKAYSEALLSFSTPRRLVSACPLAFGEVGVKSRIKSVLNYKKPALWIIIASIIVCTVTAVCLLTDPVEEKETDPFMYDRIEVTVTDDGVDKHFDRIESIKEGVRCTLPGYGDIDIITCTIETANKEKKTVTLRLDHPLCRVGTGEETNTVTLLLDHLAYDGISHDSTTLEAPDGSGIIYSFNHAMIKGVALEETVLEEEKPTVDIYIDDGMIPDPSEYYDKSVTAEVFGFLSPNGQKYHNSNNDKALRFYEALGVSLFVPIELESPPELESISVSFTNNAGDLGDYTVYEDDTVVYSGKHGGEDALYFKAYDSTFDKLILLEERMNGIYNPSGSVVASISDPKDLTKYFYAKIDGDDKADSGSLEFSQADNCYTLRIVPSTSSSGMPVSYSIVTNVKNYNLSIDNSDIADPKLVAEYDGKKVYYTFGKGGILTNAEGNNDFQLFSLDAAYGFVGKSDDIGENVRLSRAAVSGVFAFTLTVESSDTGTYVTTYVPKCLYRLNLKTDDDGFVRLFAQKGDETYTIDIITDNGKLILEGAPEDFGEAYVFPDGNISEDNIIINTYANLDSPGSSRMDAVYITEGPLSGRYSFIITVKSDLYTFSDTYAYDIYCDLEFVKLGTSKIQLKATKEDGTVSLYDVKCEYVGFEVALTCVEGDDILQKIETVEENDSFKLASFYSSESADIDGDGTAEIVTVGPGMYSGLRSFSLTIKDGDKTVGPVSFVSDSISQTLVKGDDGKLRLRAEYENEVIYYEIYPESGGILATKDGIGVK